MEQSEGGREMCENTAGEASMARPYQVLQTMLKILDLFLKTTSS